MCEESTTVIPVSVTACSTPVRNSRRASGSSDATGSSSSSSSRPFRQSERERDLGLLASRERADALTSRQAQLVDPPVGDRVVPARIQLTAELERLADREAARQRMILRDEPDTRKHGERLRARAVSEHADRPGRRRDQPDREL